MTTFVPHTVDFRYERPFIITCANETSTFLSTVMFATDKQAALEKLMQIEDLNIANQYTKFMVVDIDLEVALNIGKWAKYKTAI